jgi:hypothetical protein
MPDLPTSPDQLEAAAPVAPASGPHPRGSVEPAAPTGGGRRLPAVAAGLTALLLAAPTLAAPLAAESGTAVASCPLGSISDQFAHAFTHGVLAVQPQGGSVRLPC